MDGSPLAKYPVVLRFKGMFPHQLGKFQMHGRREGGDLGHIDMGRFDPNRPPLIGGVDWLEKAHTEVEWMRAENFANELASLEKRRRKADVIRRTSEGPKNPWRASKHGPMREVILTANKKFFGDGLEDFFGETSNVDSFRELAVSWLKENFGEDCIHARDDLDEEAYHIDSETPTGAIIATTKNLRIGSNYPSSASNTPVEIAAAMAASRWMTDDELVLMYGRIQIALAQDGIGV
ncbi:hypothetical protein RPE78_17490 (plasmid) [Thioclava litoralis]|uniref:Uncharacterized protein n=1 Tax=Thioclava litoralis TaxID=3076557 RepID=A0ABZ1E5M2_9RHOB|nr:hypothetical protein RPE78_17490 [Thioclava sp. FTW29]